MDRTKLKQMVLDLESLVEEIKAEVYSNVDSYTSPPATILQDYDEVLDLSLIHISEPTRPY